MKKIFVLLAIVGTVVLSGCDGPDGPQGPPGQDGTNVEAEVFELRNVNFSTSTNTDYQYEIYQTLTPQILLADNLLIYRLSGTIDSSTPIWKSIPRTLFLAQGELDYDFDFSKEDFTIYAGGTYNLSTTPTYLNNQTFRIVIVPGYLSNKGNASTVDTDDYQAVIQKYHINDKNVKVLN